MCDTLTDILEKYTPQNVWTWVNTTLSSWFQKEGMILSQELQDVLDSKQKTLFITTHYPGKVFKGLSVGWMNLNHDLNVVSYWKSAYPKMMHIDHRATGGRFNEICRMIEEQDPNNLLMFTLTDGSQTDNRSGRHEERLKSGFFFLAKKFQMDIVFLGVNTRTNAFDVRTVASHTDIEHIETWDDFLDEKRVQQFNTISKVLLQEEASAFMNTGENTVRFRTFDNHPLENIIFNHLTDMASMAVILIIALVVMIVFAARNPSSTDI